MEIRIKNSVKPVNLDYKLKVLKDFQEKYPTSHVGGSIGLYLRGVDLKRILQYSDLDITVDEFQFVNNQKDLELRSDGNDFDYCFKKTLDNSAYVKIDLRVNPEPGFEVIEHEGVKYNVSKLRDILFWKTSYANKGVIKHLEDLQTIKTGVRVEAKPLAQYEDDLPW